MVKVLSIQLSRAKGVERNSFFEKTKQVYLRKTNGFLGGQTEDKKVCENVGLYRCEWVSRLLQDCKISPERGFMAASPPRSCCFQSDGGSSEKAFLLHLLNLRCFQLKIFFVPTLGFRVGVHKSKMKQRRNQKRDSSCQKETWRVSAQSCLQVKSLYLILYVKTSLKQTSNHTIFPQLKYSQAKMRHDTVYPNLRETGRIKLRILV